MERQVYQKLLNWKNNGCAKPLVLNGARQVGKTWLLKKLGAEEFKNNVYVSLDEDASAQALFESAGSVEDVIAALSAKHGIEYNPKGTLFIFDEIQTCPKAITYLKYFCEAEQHFNVAAAGSLLGLSCQYGSGWPVGKTVTVDVYPLNFREFLNAMRKHTYVKFIESENYALLSGISEELKTLLKTYFIVGGMPEAVSAYVKGESLSQVREIQVQILADYERDFAKHANPALLQNLFEVWNSIPAHLAQENKKFVFGNVRKGARATNFEAALQWLEHAGIITRCFRAKKPAMPLNSYANLKCFKVFMLDVGLLGAKAGINENSIFSQSTLFTEFKGAMTEQYVCSQLVNQNIKPYYWSAENSSGEIDFLVQNAENIYAIEVKAAENLKSKSLRAFKEKYPDVIAQRYSMSNYRAQDWMTNVPLYCL